MRLSELFQAADLQILGEDVDIQRIEFDSRQVRAGDIFVCVVGTFDDGHRFAENAVKQGASALLVERELPFDIPQVIAPNSRIAMAEAAARFYDYPAKKMTMVGVTGTNGKTTTTYMIKSIAEEAGHKVGLIGTITNLIGNEVLPAEHTTPESPDLHLLLAKMVEEGVDFCVMEVSSHSLDQHRVYGIEFDLAVFTNLTQDHLDYHKTFEAYRDAKKILFSQCKMAVYNADDVNASYMVEGLPCEAMSTGIRENADIWAKEIEVTSQGVKFDMQLPGKDLMHIRLHIPGLFSVYNALSASAACFMLGIRAIDIKRGLERLLSVSGRIEPISVGERDYTILLDYAHTPDALQNVLKTIRGFADGRLVTLFGCGGNRDHAKRPIMGEVVGRYSDFCIITSDNPRNENPMDIIRQVEEGVKKTACEYIVIENRRDAIRYALAQGQPGDVILLAGKGHETYQDIAGVKSHFDEKEIVRDLLRELDEEA